MNKKLTGLAAQTEPLSIDFAADTEVVAPVTDLKRVIQLAELMVTQAKTVDELTESLRAAKEDLRRTETEDLPELMSELGMSSVALADGSSVSVNEDVECYISEERRPAAHGWLLEHGFGGLIKTQVITAFERGEIEQAQIYAAQANEAYPDHPAQLKDAVHPATLKSFVKEQLKAGNTLPFELFGVRPFNRAKYKAAKR